MQTFEHESIFSAYDFSINTSESPTIDVSQIKFVTFP